MSDALKERGWFWWGDVDVPPNQFAPEGYVTGTLTISDAGRIVIDLDGVMPTEHGPFAAFSQGVLPPDRTIAGLLKSDNRYILAINLHRAGGRWSSSGISFDQFVVQTCLVSGKMLPKSPKVRALDLDLSGYEEWLRLGQLKTTRTARSVGLRYLKKPDLRYHGEWGRLVLSRQLTSETHGSYGSRGVDLREVAKLRFTPTKSIDLPTAVQTYGLIQDLLILLTGSEYQADWPTFALTANQQLAKAYFFINRQVSQPPEYNECIASFIELKEQFGDIFFAWLEMREALGPGMYLYLATRRGLQIYEEHKFTNLVSGLESLHRSLTGDPIPPAFERKMVRILAGIANERDRTWLRKRTRGFGTPSLEQRLTEILRCVPAGINVANLRVFCAECARMRNVFAHGDHAAPTALETSSIQRVAAQNSVLSYLYHARILMEIGVPMKIIERWLSTSRDAYTMNWFMVQVGLKSGEVLRSKTAQGTSS